jgi:hypothetical protein
LPIRNVRRPKSGGGGHENITATSGNYHLRVGFVRQPSGQLGGNAVRSALGMSARRSLMRKVLITAAAASLMTFASAIANAAELSGKIVSIDPVAGTITLEDGKVIRLPASVDAASLQIGSEVKVTYEELAPEGRPTEATMVEPAG